MSLLGKKILVTGGNGYLGNYFAARFVQQKASVMALSRSGPRHKHPQNSAIQWLKGNIMEPSGVREEVNSADIIVHTIGTLFDTSVTKKAKPGEAGTYEQMNRDTLTSLLSILEKPKKVIYISSASHPPFLSRYLTTKYEAEKILMDSQHEGYSLRPGFIYSWKHRKWSIPIKWEIDFWNAIYPTLQKIPESSKVSEYLREFKQGENVALEDLGDSVLELSLNGGQKQINQAEDIRAMSVKYQNENKQ